MNYNDIIRAGADTMMTEREFLEQEISAWIGSPDRLMMMTAERYYDGQHDILNRKREAIGADGTTVEIKNLPNNKLIDNQYAKAVDQKVNYSFARPFSIDTTNKSYADLLNTFFDSRFRRMFKNLAKDAINGGVDWLHPYYDGNGQLKLKRFRPWEVLPFWRDADHTELDSFVRVYEVQGYEGKVPVTITKVEYVDLTGIKRYELVSGHLIDDVEAGDESTHFIVTAADGTETPMNWERIPLIAFKFDDRETPLIKRVKGLQDALNTMKSDFMNVMQEDARNTILVIKNYDGTNLGEFRQNLATYGAVKVRSVDGADGGVDTLTIEVNSANYESILKLIKDALIENARAMNAKDDRMGNSPNEMNIKSMYSDLDLDANGIEAEFKAGFEELIWFISMHFYNSGAGDYTAESVEIVFNRDIMMNEAQAITNCQNSSGTVSRKTILTNHPWVTDIEAEIKELDAEAKKAAEFYSTPNPEDIDNGDGGGANG